MKREFAGFIKVKLPNFYIRNIAMINFGQRSLNFIAGTIIDVGLHRLLLQGVSKSKSFGDIIFLLRKIKDKPNFSVQFKKINKRCFSSSCS